jgi:hypothetical protein
MTSTLESLAHGLIITEYSDWVIFVERLKDAVQSGRVRKIPALKRVWSRSEEWFLDAETGEVYVYLPPNPPTLPRWKKVDVLQLLETTDADPAPLSVFKIGQITPMMAHIMKMNLEDLVSRGSVEAIPPPVAALSSKDRTETWYRDKASNIVYRLSEYYGLKDADDIRWEIVPQSELSGKIQ